MSASNQHRLDRGRELWEEWVGEQSPQEFLENALPGQSLETALRDYMQWARAEWAQSALSRADWLAVLAYATQEAAQ